MISRRNFFGKTIGIGAAAVGLLGFRHSAKFKWTQGEPVEPVLPVSRLLAS